MKASQPWHGTPLGRAALFLGSVQLAVPVMVFVAAALAWGTYLESTQSSKVARAAVYASWWFIALMGMVCVSLIFAVVVRYPWKRRHVGFITVHTGLLMLIGGGFWSLFARVEGRLTLEEGTAGDAIELDEDVIELAELSAGVTRTVASATAPVSAASLALDGLQFRVVERWGNVREEQYVADDGPEPYRAIEVAPGGATVGTWVGDEVIGGAPAVLDGLAVRVLPDGATWEPPATPAPAADAGIAFIVGPARHPLGAEGQEAFPGWTVESIRTFKHAMVSADGLTESDPAHDNPATDVVVTDGRGTRERHTVFLAFPEMIMSRTLEGQAKSGARLVAAQGTGGTGGESLILYGPVGAPQIGYIGAEGAGRRIDIAGPPPWTIDAGQRRITILRQFTRARNASRFVQAPPASEFRPALLVRIGDAAEPVPVAWKAFVPVSLAGRNLALRFGPRTHPLPFTVQLQDFRKLDYPGTDMAMSYESDVAVTHGSEPAVPFRIFMNNPYEHNPWKVYQSGFVGDTISVFSVMKDPGIPLTYAGSIVLCVGLVVTFYSRSLSWGHPGIPIEFAAHAPTGKFPPKQEAPDGPAIAAAPGRDPVADGVHAGLQGAGLAR